jgi:hypothetical protein
MSGSWGCLKGGSCGRDDGHSARVRVGTWQDYSSCLIACPPILVWTPLGFRLLEQHQLAQR